MPIDKTLRYRYKFRYQDGCGQSGIQYHNKNSGHLEFLKKAKDAKDSVIQKGRKPCSYISLRKFIHRWKKNSER